MQQQKITASAYIHKDSKVLLVKRAETETFAPGHWELPGGHIEFGETVEDGLNREVQEETGLKVKFGETFHQFTYVSDNSKDHYIELILTATLEDENQEVTLNPQEHSEFKWVTRGEFTGNYQDMFEFERQAIQAGFTLLG